MILVLVISLVTNTKTAIKRTQYECVPDKWRNEHVHDNQAAQEVLDALLESADKGDREAFAKNFTPKLQAAPGFEDALEDFFCSYPVGLSECGIKVGTVGGGGSYDHGHNVLTAGTGIDLWMDGNWYTIGIGFCYENTDNPDEVGVTEFTIRNLEGDAFFRNEYSKDQGYLEDEYLVCSIMSSDEVSARLINGMTFLWKDTPEPKLTEDEMRTLLTDHRDDGIGSPEVLGVIGEPNVSYKSPHATGYDYYYELAPKSDGTPQYVYICTSGPHGRIIDAYLCDTEDQYYDDPIVEWIKPDR